MAAKPVFILSIVYGYIGVWEGVLVNFSHRSYITFEHLSPTPNLSTAYWIEEHREKLLDTLKQDLKNKFKEKHSLDVLHRLLSLSQIISESIISTCTYYEES